jgi:hypothetical protein
MRSASCGTRNAVALQSVSERDRLAREWQRTGGPRHPPLGAVERLRTDHAPTVRERSILVNGLAAPRNPIGLPERR